MKSSLAQRCLAGTVGSAIMAAKRRGGNGATALLSDRRRASLQGVAAGVAGHRSANCRPRSIAVGGGDGEARA